MKMTYLFTLALYYILLLVFICSFLVFKTTKLVCVCGGGLCFWNGLFSFVNELKHGTNSPSYVEISLYLVVRENAAMTLV